jgi:hypothetical protein
MGCQFSAPAEEVVAVTVDSRPRRYTPTAMPTANAEAQNIDVPPSPSMCTLDEESLTAKAALPASARIAAEQEELRSGSRAARQRELSAERRAVFMRRRLAAGAAAAAALGASAQRPMTNLSLDPAAAVAEADRMDHFCFASADDSLQVAALEPCSVSMTPLALRGRGAAHGASPFNGSSEQPSRPDSSGARDGVASAELSCRDRATMLRSLGLSDPE